MPGWRAALGWLCAAALAVIPASAAAAPDIATIDLDRERAAIGQFQDADQRLQDVGWALARGNAPFCDRIVPSVGLQLQDIASYGQPDIARAALGLKGAFAVQTAARGSPAALSGAFVRNREIARIGDLDPNTLPAGERLHWQRLAAVHDRIAQMLADRGAVTFEFADGSRTTLNPVPVCETDFVLVNSDKQRLAKGGFEQVAIGTAFPAFAYPEPVFAGVVAHELAHSVLRHSRWLRRNKRKRRNIRETEREADRMMPWLMANAGYDPQAAVAFMQTWGKNHDLGIFRSWAYDGWDERADRIAAELPLVRDLMARAGRADWSVHFRRQIDPAQGMDAETIRAEAEAAQAARTAYLRFAPPEPGSVPRILPDPVLPGDGQTR
jgi:hypothetical protein